MRKIYKILKDDIKKVVRHRYKVIIWYKKHIMPHYTEVKTYTYIGALFEKFMNWLICRIDVKIEKIEK